MFPVSTTVAIRFPPFATWALIALNVVVYLLEVNIQAAGGMAGLQAFLQHWALVPARYFMPAWALANGLDPADYLPFVTNTFLHGGFLHLALNMWTLYIFGPAVENRMGSLVYVIFYLACGVGASIAHAWFNASSTLPALGASGAVAGIIGAYMELFPRSRVVVMIPVFFYPFFFEVYAAFFAMFWFATQLINGIGSLASGQAMGGVAWWAHIGGFALGWLVAAVWGREGRRHRPAQPDEGAFGCCPDGRRDRRRAS